MSKNKDLCVCYSTLDVLPAAEAEEAIAEDLSQEETPEKKQKVLDSLAEESCDET